MKQVLRLSIALVCLSAVLTVGECSPLVKKLGPIDHHKLEELTKMSINRDKRKVDVVTGVKNAVLGFVFNNPASKGFAWDVVTTTKRPTTTEEYVTFEPGKPVSLEIPDKLFGSSFTLVTNLSTTVGDFMMNSALRAQRLLESMRPFLQGVFGAKGFVIEATTDKPIFSDPSST